MGAALEAAGYKVDHIDLCGVSNPEEAIDNYSGAAIFGITATTPQVPAALRIAALLRKREGVKVIIGGPHPTLLHAAAKRGNQRAQKALTYLLECFDVVVAGDGEKAIFTALHSRGLVDADDPKGILWNTSKDFAESPWPARHLVDMESYHYRIGDSKSTSMIAQLGCPFHSLTADSFVFTSQGFERIEELKLRQKAGIVERCIHGETIVRYDISEPVASRDGIRVASALLDEGIHPVYEVQHQFGIPLRGTFDHPVLTVDGESLVWKHIGELRSNDWIACKFPDPITTELQPLTIVPSLRTVPPGGFRSRNIRVPSVMDEELAWLVGFMLGDGCIPLDGRPSIHVCVIDEFKQRLLLAFRNQFDVHLHINKASTTDNMEHGWVHSRAVYEFFVQTLAISPSRKLNVPDVIRRSRPSVIRAFLNGLWDADGYENDSCNYLTTVNEEFARQVSMLLLMVRKIPMLRRIEGNGYKHGLHWRVGIAMSDKIPVLKSLYKSTNSSKWHWRTQKSINRSGIRRSTLRLSGLSHPLDIDGMFYSKVDAVVPSGNEVVYDLTVPEGETFVANGVVVHNCKFCGGRNSPMLRQIRVRPSESVIDEMMHLHHAYGMTGVMHFQDELNVSHKGLVDLMVKIKNTGIPWQQRGFVKAELFNDEQAEAMYAAGFRWLLCGFESAHPRILTNIAKNATREQNTQMLRTAHKHGIKVKALMSAGHPGESEETILATRDWLLEEKPDDFDVTIITVYPGTPYFDESVLVEEPVYKFTTNGDSLYIENTDFHNDMQYYKGAPGAYKSYVWTDHISRERLCELRDEVEDEVRTKLGIPYATGAAAINFEHSMGQHLPPTILRSSK